ncbi:hypothetical protein GJ496_001845 [Pomphorhynchus laevis]|nr:hypothetical protein GJ496_001845 [Pomphorhynchus laevis]
MSGIVNAKGLIAFFLAIKNFFNPDQISDSNLSNVSKYDHNLDNAFVYPLGYQPNSTNKKLSYQIINKESENLTNLQSGAPSSFSQDNNKTAIPDDIQATSETVPSGLKQHTIQSSKEHLTFSSEYSTQYSNSSAQWSVSHSSGSSLHIPTDAIQTLSSNDNEYPSYTFANNQTTIQIPVYSTQIPSRLVPTSNLQTTGLSSHISTDIEQSVSFRSHEYSSSPDTNQLRMRRTVYSIQEPNTSVHTSDFQTTKLSSNISTDAGQLVSSTVSVYPSSSTASDQSTMQSSGYSSQEQTGSAHISDFETTDLSSHKATDAGQSVPPTSHEYSSSSIGAEQFTSPSSVYSSQEPRGLVHTSDLGTTELSSHESTDASQSVSLYPSSSTVSDQSTMQSSGYSSQEQTGLVHTSDFETTDLSSHKATDAGQSVPPTAHEYLSSSIDTDQSTMQSPVYSSQEPRGLVHTSDLGTTELSSHESTDARQSVSLAVSVYPSSSTASDQSTMQSSEYSSQEQTGSVHTSDFETTDLSSHKATDAGQSVPPTAHEYLSSSIDTDQSTMQSPVYSSQEPRGLVHTSDFETSDLSSHIATDAGQSVSPTSHEYSSSSIGADQSTSQSSVYSSQEPKGSVHTSDLGTTELSSHESTDVRQSVSLAVSVYPSSSTASDQSTMQSSVYSSQEPRGLVHTSDFETSDLSSHKATDAVLSVSPTSHEYLSSSIGADQSTSQSSVYSSQEPRGLVHTSDLGTTELSSHESTDARQSVSLTVSVYPSSSTASDQSTMQSYGYSSHEQTGSVHTSDFETTDLSSHKATDAGQSVPPTAHEYLSSSIDTDQSTMQSPVYSSQEPRGLVHTSDFETSDLSSHKATDAGQSVSPTSHEYSSSSIGADQSTSQSFVYSSQEPKGSVHTSDLETTELSSHESTDARQSVSLAVSVYPSSSTASDQSTMQSSVYSSQEPRGLVHTSDFETTDLSSHKATDAGQSVPPTAYAYSSSSIDTDQSTMQSPVYSSQEPRGLIHTSDLVTTELSSHESTDARQSVSPTVSVYPSSSTASDQSTMQSSGYSSQEHTGSVHTSDFETTDLSSHKANSAGQSVSPTAHEYSSSSISADQSTTQSSVYSSHEPKGSVHTFDLGTTELSSHESTDARQSATEGINQSATQGIRISEPLTSEQNTFQQTSGMSFTLFKTLTSPGLVSDYFSSTKASSDMPTTETFDVFHVEPTDAVFIKINKNNQTTHFSTEMVPSSIKEKIENPSIYKTDNYESTIQSDQSTVKDVFSPQESSGFDPSVSSQTIITSSQLATETGQSMSSHTSSSQIFTEEGQSVSPLDNGYQSYFSSSDQSSSTRSGYASQEPIQLNSVAQTNGMPSQISTEAVESISPMINGYPSSSIDVEGYSSSSLISDQTATQNLVYSSQEPSRSVYSSNFDSNVSSSSDYSINTSDDSTNFSTLLPTYMPVSSTFLNASNFSSTLLPVTSHLVANNFNMVSRDVQNLKHSPEYLHPNRNQRRSVARRRNNRYDVNDVSSESMYIRKYPVNRQYHKRNDDDSSQYPIRKFSKSRRRRHSQLRKNGNIQDDSSYNLNEYNRRNYHARNPRRHYLNNYIDSTAESEQRPLGSVHVHTHRDGRDSSEMERFMHRYPKRRQFK